jgi:hypothetical protein
MKLFLEEDTNELDEKGELTTSTKLVKEVKDLAEATTLKTANKCYLHKCYHDEKSRKPCTREVL